MTPLEFLKEELENVKRALTETLRYDYVPERSEQYYAECTQRLARVGQAISRIGPGDPDQIAARLQELTLLAHWISLIERSRLGEFSWPFAEELNRLAAALLFETNMKGERLDPVIHVISEGAGGYRISYERNVPSAIGWRRFVIVFFPRSLKHHVLLHSIFGHELCHTAFHTSVAGKPLRQRVVTAFRSAGPLQSEAAANVWANLPAAPAAFRQKLTEFLAQTGTAFRLSGDHLAAWVLELICDLFGLVLFGPAFLAAHKALLEPLHPAVYGVSWRNPTHPPYAVRHKMLVQALRILGWDRPVIAPNDRKGHAAETELITYLTHDPYDPWAFILTDVQVQTAIQEIKAMMHPGIAYSPSDSRTVSELLTCLSEGVPPVISSINEDGAPILKKIDVCQTLYAGWIFWLGQKHVALTGALDFFTTNRLCDLALLQQRAINAAVDGGVK